MLFSEVYGTYYHILSLLLQKAVEIQPDDTPEVLQRRVMEQAEWILLPQATEMLSKQISEE